MMAAIEETQKHAHEAQACIDEDADDEQGETGDAEDVEDSQDGGNEAGGEEGETGDDEDVEHNQDGGYEAGGEGEMGDDEEKISGSGQKRPVPVDSLTDVPSTKRRCLLRTRATKVAEVIRSESKEFVDELRRVANGEVSARLALGVVVLLIVLVI